MSIAELRNEIPDYGRDIRLNLENVLSEQGAPGLGAYQISVIGLACAYSLGSAALTQAILADAQGVLDDTAKESARAAATIMAMNNVYYRSTHLLDDAELKKLPARLRMNVIGKPGVAKSDFELMCFAVSALAGCGQCLTSHLHELRKAGVSDEAVQSSLRIASVLNAADRALKIKEL
jgi:alkyl hydroperoxide reductase subunit D